VNQKPPKSKIPKGVWTLGFVSLFMDWSSELIHSLLPIFLVTTLGANMVIVGLVEGIAEASAQIIRIFSGIISDFFARRKILLLLGYGLAALSKPLFPWADSVLTVFFARFMDRIGKGIRGAPRDALIADLSPPEIRGACFGLRQSMDTVGAFLGPLVAILLLYWSNDNLRLVLWAAVIPAIIAVLIVALWVKEPIAKKPGVFHSPLKWHVFSLFSGQFWWVVWIGGLFALARFSEAFLILRVQQTGFPVTLLPLIMVIMSLFYAVSAYPAGIISDHVNKKVLLGIALILLFCADLMLANSNSIVFILSGVAIWGLHMGFSQGILSALIAETTLTELKATAFGIFGLISGLLMLLASILAGWLWDQYGAEYSFYCSAFFALLALCSLFVMAVVNTSGP
jgi:MFS family permease